MELEVCGGWRAEVEVVYVETAVEGSGGGGAELNTSISVCRDTERVVLAFRAAFVIEAQHMEGRDLVIGVPGSCCTYGMRDCFSQR
ncbi:hypothetical protein FHG87_014483 [Trinorchestia longiramus]|nr:hypothetical protein FHG87_014483 [Trinorchestia longiramus]